MKSKIELTQNQKLDIVLKAFDNPDEPDSYEEFAERIKEKGISDIDSQRCIDKLIKDGYVKELNGGSRLLIDPIIVKWGSTEAIVKNERNLISSFYITIDGRNFIKKGGYQVLARQPWRQKNTIDNFFKVLTLVLTVYSIYLSKVNSNFKTTQDELEQRLIQIQSKTPTIQNYIVLPDSTFQKIEH